jgi:hypothetical protein
MARWRTGGRSPLQNWNASLDYNPPRNRTDVEAAQQVSEDVAVRCILFLRAANDEFLLCTHPVNGSRIQQLD